MLTDRFSFENKDVLQNETNIVDINYFKSQVEITYLMRCNGLIPKRVASINPYLMYMVYSDAKGEFIFRPYATLRNGKVIHPKKGKMLKIYIKKK